MLTGRAMADIQSVVSIYPGTYLNLELSYDKKTVK